MKNCWAKYKINVDNAFQKAMETQKNDEVLQASNVITQNQLSLAHKQQQLNDEHVQLQWLA